MADLPACGMDRYDLGLHCGPGELWIASYVRLEVPEAADFTLEQFDVTGRRVDRKVSEGLTPGTWRLGWRAPRPASPSRTAG